MPSVHGLEYLRIAPVTQNPKAVPRRTRRRVESQRPGSPSRGDSNIPKSSTRLRNHNDDLYEEDHDGCSEHPGS
jgi:hypothetical protein